MINGTPNRPLYFYQKDIIGVQYLVEIDPPEQPWRWEHRMEP